MAYYKTSSVEKPYELIPFASNSVKREQPEGHEALEEQKRTGRMKIYLFPREPVQVASGNQYLRKGEVLQEESFIRRYDKEGKARRKRVLPGSSIKGAIRSMTELLSPSCVPLHSRQTRRHIPHSHKACGNAKELCPACRLFGMSGGKNENYLGQVHIEDAIMQEGETTIVHTPELWTPTGGSGGLPSRYLNGRDVSGRKIYYHSQAAEGKDGRVALEIGAQLQTWLHFENLTKGELGLLIAAWGLHPKYPFLPKIGAAKPVGMGTVEVHLTVIELYRGVKQSGRLGGKRKPFYGKKLQKIIPTLLKVAEEEGLLLEDALRNVIEVLKPENLARPPVEGNY